MGIFSNRKSIDKRRLDPAFRALEMNVEVQEKRNRLIACGIFAGAVASIASLFLRLGRSHMRGL